MVLTHIHLLPVFIFVLIPSSFLLTYCIAIYLNHVEVGFPYISDTGVYLPERCIFSQAINIVAFMLAAFMYIQYKHIEQHCRDFVSSEFTIVLKLNRWALFIGWLGCFGVSVLANFQETAVIVVHISGAVLAFGSATLYSWMLAIISHYVCPLLNSLMITRIRVFLCLVLTAAFGITLVSGIISRTEFHGKDPTKWHEGDGGFTAHVVSTAAEWILVMSFDFFVLTYAREMQNISVSSPQIHFMAEDLTLANKDFYTSENHFTITSSQNSLQTVHSLPHNPYPEVLSTEAQVH